jgi:hypothetical protein
MGALTPKRAELARQIRAASAQLRSPAAIAAPARRCLAAGEAAGGDPALAGILAARRRRQAEAEANDEGFYARDDASPRCGAAAAAPPAAGASGPLAGPGDSSPHGAVDLRALRLQMERSLARLQAGELTPPPASHGAGAPAADPAPAGWAPHVADHFCRRRGRGVARAALLGWFAVAERHSRDGLEQLAARLQRELDEAEMQLAESRDPARTQVCFPPLSRLPPWALWGSRVGSSCAKAMAMPFPLI